MITNPSKTSQQSLIEIHQRCNVNHASFLTFKQNELTSNSNIQNLNIYFKVIFSNKIWILIFFLFVFYIYTNKDISQWFPSRGNSHQPHPALASGHG